MNRMEDLDALAIQARAGDRPATERLLRAVYPDVWRLCALLVDREAADDLAQETCARAVGALKRFRAEAAVRTWLLGIARRVCADELRARTRRRRRDQRLSPGAAELTVPSAQESSAVAVNELIRALDPTVRAAFVLTQMFALSYADAAEACDCPIGTIRSRVARARRELLELLDAPVASHG